MMQLATSQRPHPPPVPPRPSRQVVAEALKRSPRPPCPTRQAPPLPNTRPWRSDNREISQKRAGRTIIYESLKKSSNYDEIRSSSEPPVTKEFLKRDNILPRRRSNDELIGRIVSSENIGKLCFVDEKHVNDCDISNVAKSERYEAENNRERHDKRQQTHEKKSQFTQLLSNSEENCDLKNFTVQSRESKDDAGTRTDERSLISNYEKNVNKQPLIVTSERFDVFTISPMDDKSQENEEKTRTIDSFQRIKIDAIGKNFQPSIETMLEDLTNDNVAETLENDRSNVVNNLTKSAESLSLLGKNLDIQGSETSTMRVSTIVAKTGRVTSDGDIDPRNKSDETIDRTEEEDYVDKTYGSTTTISSDDCATVVVIDEPERKIAFNEDNDNIQHQDWLEAGVRYSSTKITLSGDEAIERSDELSLPDDDDNDDDDNHEDVKDENERRAYTEIDFASIRERIAMSSLQGLPPLPRSLSGFNLNEGRREACDPPPPPARSSSKTSKNVKSTQSSGSRPSPPGRQLTTLDTQLAILRKEMFGLRQLDLSLLSQLWSLNESIQEFRQLLQDQEDRAPSPSPSSEEGDETSYGIHPPPPPRRPAPLLHHHRPPRPPRPLRPPASDESPSSEEYGAV